MGKRERDTQYAIIGYIIMFTSVSTIQELTSFGERERRGKERRTRKRGFHGENSK